MKQQLQQAKRDAAPKAVAFDSSSAAAAARVGGRGGRRVCSALDAAAYYGLMPAFKLILEASKRKLTLQHCKSCAAAAAASDQVSIIKLLMAEVVGSADDMYWPEAAAVAAASDHWQSLQYMMSASPRSWPQPVICSLSPCARSSILHVAAAHQSNRVLVACCSHVRASQPPPSDAKLDPWAYLFRAVDCSGSTVLHVAVTRGCADATIAAIASCACDTLNARDCSGSSVLHIACSLMRLDTVKALIAMGADRTAKDGSSRSAAAVAVAACSAQQAQHNDPKARTALQQRCLEIVQLLFDAPCVPSLSGTITATLMSACASGDPLVVAAARAGIENVVGYLLDKDRACAHAKGRGGECVLDVFLSSKDSRGIDLLVQVRVCVCVSACACVPVCLCALSRARVYAARTLNHMCSGGWCRPCSGQVRRDEMPVSTLRTR